MSIIKCKVYAKALEAWKEWYLKYSFSKIKLITIWLSMIKLVGSSEHNVGMSFLLSTLNIIYTK